MPQQYVALLRAIAHVSMGPFRAGMEELGYTDVESYGMSGNLLYNAAHSDVSEHERRITAKFGTPAIVRTRAALTRVVGQIPFESDVLFLAQTPNAARRRAFLGLEFEAPQPVLRGKTVFFVHPARLPGKRSPFNFEEALGMGTARSARVVRQILVRMLGTDSRRRQSA